MCNSCTCKCKSELSLEVGKTYVNGQSNTKVKIVYKSENKHEGYPFCGVEIFSDGSTRIFKFSSNGTCQHFHGFAKLTKEYKETTYRYFPIWKCNASFSAGAKTREDAIKHGKTGSTEDSPLIAIGKINQDTCEIEIEKV